MAVTNTATKPRKKKNPAPQNKPNVPRPWHVIGPAFFGPEYTWHRCATEEQAQGWLDRYQRSAPFLRPTRIEFVPPKEPTT